MYSTVNMLRNESKERVVDETTSLLVTDQDDENIPHQQDDVFNSFLKMKYPKSVFFIISNEFCERFSYYGMRAVLSLYLTSALSYNTDAATVLYHVFTMLCYFTPLFGAIVADSFLGKFRTILYLSMVYALGNIVLSISAVPVIPLPHREISLLGLLFIAIGTGGIKPCVSAFGGDQFVLPEQAIQLQKFFSLFYFSINAGSTISTFLTPSLRNDVKCFSQQSCFPLAFGVPAILMITSVVIFVLGKRQYKMKKPEENIIVIFIDCIWRGLKNKVRGVNTENKSHWLETADDKYDKQRISDIRAVLSVLVLFTPVPIFWALYDQQGSRWTFQATNMDGRIFGFTIKPDQMQVLNPLLILVFIPLFELFVYPSLKTIGVKRPLQKLTIGGFLAAVAFGCSAIVESAVEGSYSAIPISGTGNLRIFNSLNCSITLNPSIEDQSVIAPFSTIKMLKMPVNESKTFEVNFRLSHSCTYRLDSVNENVKIFNMIDTSYFIGERSGSLWISQPIQDTLSKDNDGAVKLRFFYGSPLNQSLNFKMKESTTDNAVLSNNIHENEVTNLQLLKPGKYDVLTKDNEVLMTGVELNPGEIDTIVISENLFNRTQGVLFNLAPANTVHMLWQLPQIIIITAGEIMFSVTGLEFSFTQAPQSMKSVVSAAWLLTVAFGNLLVVVISELKFFESQAYEFLLFSVLMIVDVLALIILSVRYKYVSYEDGLDAASINNGSLEPAPENGTIMTSLSGYNSYE